MSNRPLFPPTQASQAHCVCYEPTLQGSPPISVPPNPFALSLSKDP